MNLWNSCAKYLWYAAGVLLIAAVYHHIRLPLPFFLFFALVSLVAWVYAGKQLIFSASHIPGTVYEFLTGRLPIERMEEGLIENIEEDLAVLVRPRRWYFYLKYIFDYTLLLLLIVPALLCMGVISLAILCTSGGPVFFVQERVGKNGVPFRMVKFRSMTDGREITGIGRILRKFRLDELPQMWNIFRGEMSFIGPRPEVPDLVRLYTEKIPFYAYRHSVLPGLSGWAQVKYRYASDAAENKIKLGYDLYYVKHASLSLDVLVVLGTLKTALLGRGE